MESNSTTYVEIDWSQRTRDVNYEFPLYDPWGIVLMGALLVLILAVVTYHTIRRWQLTRWASRSGCDNMLHARTCT